MKNDGIELFYAGKIGEKNKIHNYKNKFLSMYDQGYIFVPFAMENLGGISIRMKKVLHHFLNCKAKRIGVEPSVVKNNFWIELSTTYHKKVIEILKDHMDFC